MLSLDEYLSEAERVHGHMCPGQVLGVRMAMTGCRAVGVLDPISDRKALITFIEIDRCAADAISVVTGCRLGKRALKYLDYGKLAATFYNTRTGDAVRIAALDSSRKLAQQLFPDLSKKEQQLRCYREAPDEDLFSVQSVRLVLPPEDLPGPPIARVTCAACGEGVNDRREVAQNGQVLCRACAYGAYYEPLSSPTA